VFSSRLGLKVAKGGDPDIRLGLYDMDNDGVITEQELIGEAFVKASQISVSTPVTLPLSKSGKTLIDTYILVNPTAASIAKTREPLQYSVAVGCRCVVSVARRSWLGAARTPIHSLRVVLGAGTSRF
jgi:hypothetical protein